MLINFNDLIRTPAGSQMNDQSGEPLHLGDVCLMVLTAEHRDEKIPAFEKLRRYKFSEKLINPTFDEDDPDSLRYVTKNISTQQRDKLCTLTEEIYAGGVYGSVYKLLHGGKIELPEDGEDWTAEEEVDDEPPLKVVTGE